MFYVCLNCFQTLGYLDLSFNDKTQQNSSCCKCIVEIFDENGEQILSDGSTLYYKDFIRMNKGEQYEKTQQTFLANHHKQRTNTVGESMIEMPDIKDYSSYKNFFEAVRLWQVVEMGNDCTICHGNNMVNRCGSCNWWGKVKPEVSNHE